MNRQSSVLTAWMGGYPRDPSLYLEYRQDMVVRFDERQGLAVEQLLATTSWEIPHVQQVRRISSWLFEALREFHGFGAREELLLLTAALLHDVGYPVDPAMHHKVSAKMIRTALGPPFEPDEVDLIALLARYHRKGGPKLRHRRYGALSPHDRRVVNLLGGILRVADGLDRGHDSAVQWLGSSIYDQRLEIRVSDRGSTRLTFDEHRGDDVEDRAVLEIDVTGAMRKRDVLERAIGRPVIIRTF